MWVKIIEYTDFGQNFDLGKKNSKNFDFGEKLRKSRFRSKFRLLIAYEYLIHISRLPQRI